MNQIELYNMNKHLIIIFYKYIEMKMISVARHAYRNTTNLNTSFEIKEYTFYVLMIKIIKTFFKCVFKNENLKFINTFLWFFKR